MSVDPLQFDYPQLTPFNYAGNKPVTHIDIDGMQSTGDEKQGIDFTIKPAEYHTTGNGSVTDNGSLGKLADNTVTAAFNIITGFWNLGVNSVSTVNYNIDYLITNGPEEYADAVKKYWSGEADQFVKDIKSLKNLTPQDIDNFLSSPQGFELMVGIAASEFGVKLTRGAKGEIVAEPMETKTTATKSKSIAKSEPTAESPSKITSETATKKTTKYTKYNFRNNLIKETGINPGKKSHAHHVFVQKFESTFESMGLDINDPKFGVWWEKTSHLKNASAFNASWESFLLTNPSKSEIMNHGRGLMRQYGIPVLF